MKIRTYTAELLRTGKRHGQLLSPLTRCVGVCEDHAAGIVTIRAQAACRGALRAVAAADEGRSRELALLDLAARGIEQIERERSVSEALERYGVPPKNHWQGEDGVLRTAEKLAVLLAGEGVTERDWTPSWGGPGPAAPAAPPAAKPEEGGGEPGAGGGSSPPRRTSHLSKPPKAPADSDGLQERYGFRAFFPPRGEPGLRVVL